MSFNKAKVLKSAEKYVQQGKIAAAIEEYRKIVEADPNDLTMINTLGDLCVRAGRTEEAIMNFSRIAENYRENGFTLKAIAMYKKINKLEPANYETSLKLADLYSKQGLIVDARQQYLIVADAYKRNGQTKKALEVLKKIADLDPENTSVRLKLAESYQLEGLNEEAHEAYFYAGQEFLRKGNYQESILSFQRALGINPYSKSVLKAMADAFAQHGELQKAFDMLGQALEKNPGDIDLIVILGRTYLNAKMLEDAESTFSRLLELDKSRYDYLIEVGRRYLERGQFDRTIAVVDRCIDLLIARRQEEKAIALLKGILEYDANHMVALKRLADIYMRVREDHNLSTTLNMIVEAALRRGLRPEAINALKQLIEIEPDEPSYKQRLANLGVSEPVSLTPGYSIPLAFETSTAAKQPPIAPGLMPPKATANDAQSAEKQLREAEMFASRGYADHAAELLEELISQHPNYIEARLKLKQLYIDGGLEEKAATQCMALARIYEEQGDAALANDLLSEAYELNPSLGNIPAQVNGAGVLHEQASPSTKSNHNPTINSVAMESDGAIEIDLSSGLSEISMDSLGYQPQQSYQPPAFNQMPNDMFASPPPMPATPPEPTQPPSSFADLFSGTEAPSPVTNVPPVPLTIKGATDQTAEKFSGFEINLTDESTATMQMAREKILRDELEGVDFYIAQGYLEIARDTLENLDKQYPNHPAILQRFAHLGGDRGRAPTPSLGASGSDIYIEPIEDISLSAIMDAPSPSEIANSGWQSDNSESSITLPPLPEPPEPPPIPDTLAARAQSLTNDETARSAAQASAASFFDSLVSDIEQSLEEMPTSDMLPMANTVSSPQSAPTPIPENENAGLEAGLLSIFEEFKSGLEQNEVPDFETHYNLGLAYKDMELYDDAIEEFQIACKATSATVGDGHYFNCCNMLGFCFLQNKMARPSAVWYKRGLESPGRSEEEYQAMRYDLANAYERLGEYDRALDLLQEVYAIDINYRNVSSKIRDLHELIRNNAANGQRD
ncbi:MAG: tetratricopeptide repeat protein [Acidobacteriota bacterium]